MSPLQQKAVEVSQNEYVGSWWQVFHRAWGTGCIIWWLVQRTDAPFVRTALIGAGLMVGGSVALMILALVARAIRVLRG